MKKRVISYLKSRIVSELDFHKPNRAKLAVFLIRAEYELEFEKSGTYEVDFFSQKNIE